MSTTTECSASYATFNLDSRYKSVVRVGYTTQAGLGFPSPLIGEEFLYAHKDMLTKRVSEKFKEKFNQVITMPDAANVAQ